MIFRRWWSLAAVAAVTFASVSMAWSAERKAYPTFGTVERLDPRFDVLVPKTPNSKRSPRASIGPKARCGTSGKCLLFSDILPTA